MNSNWKSFRVWRINATVKFKRPLSGMVLKETTRAYLKARGPSYYSQIAPTERLSRQHVRKSTSRPLPGELRSDSPIIWYNMQPQKKETEHNKQIYLKLKAEQSRLEQPYPTSSRPIERKKCVSWGISYGKLSLVFKRWTSQKWTAAKSTTKASVVIFGMI